MYISMQKSRENYILKSHKFKIGIILFFKLVFCSFADVLNSQRNQVLQNIRSVMHFRVAEGWFRFMRLYINNFITKSELNYIETSSYETINDFIIIIFLQAIEYINGNWKTIIAQYT